MDPAAVAYFAKLRRYVHSIYGTYWQLATYVAVVIYS